VLAISAKSFCTSRIGFGKPDAAGLLSCVEAIAHRPSASFLDYLAETSKGALARGLTAVQVISPSDVAEALPRSGFRSFWP